MRYQAAPLPDGQEIAKNQTIGNNLFGLKRERNRLYGSGSPGIVPDYFHANFKAIKFVPRVFA